MYTFSSKCHVDENSDGAIPVLKIIHYVRTNYSLIIVMDPLSEPS